MIHNIFSYYPLLAENKGVNYVKKYIFAFIFLNSLQKYQTHFE